MRFIIFWVISFCAISETSIKVSSVLMDKGSFLTENEYICLGNNWKNFNSLIELKIKKLKENNQYLFTNISSEKINCFTPLNVSLEEKDELDNILNIIDSNLKHDLEFEILPLRNQNKHLLRKVGRSSFIAGVGETLTIGVLIALPTTVTNWNDNYRSTIPQTFKKAWTSKPVFDKDDWYINYVGHPISGAFYYNLLRSQGVGPFKSFLFSTAASTVWEYGPEALCEQPSIQDIWSTPVIGSVIGELSHLATMKMRRNGFNTFEKVLITIINPSYVINNGLSTHKRR